MLDNNYLSNYRAFVEEFRQFSGKITKDNLHSFIFEITSAHSSTELRGPEKITPHKFEPVPLLEIFREKHVPE
ncbi:hypothetical protein [Lacticaseibacillus camelliae]|uniref:hypothetical protein n=1 Tax=Lacticaseibacillus camelliae TaxID=381742 RepID=UPI001F2640B7|nr:hypothetical protein [Lacticaseibacillus camelliae]